MMLVAAASSKLQGKKYLEWYYKFQWSVIGSNDYNFEISDRIDLTRVGG